MHLADDFIPPLATHLNVHLDDGLAYEGGSKERPERNEEVSAGDASKVKQVVGDLVGQRETHNVPL